MRSSARRTWRTTQPTSEWRGWWRARGWAHAGTHHPGGGGHGHAPISKGPWSTHSSWSLPAGSRMAASCTPLRPGMNAFCCAPLPQTAGGVQQAGSGHRQRAGDCAQLRPRQVPDKVPGAGVAGARGRPPGAKAAPCCARCWACPRRAQHYSRPPGEVDPSTTSPAAGTCCRSTTPWTTPKW